MISRLRKRNKTLTNEQEQYKGALCTFNKEVMALTEKLKKEARLREKVQEEKNEFGGRADGYLWAGRDSQG